MKKFLVFAAVAALPSLMAVDKNSPMLKEFLQEAAVFAGGDEQKELAAMSRMRWESHREYEIIFSNADFYSFKAVESSYTGGAHGMTVTVVGTFYRGKQLKLADLGDRQLLQEKWQQAIARHFKAKNYAEYIRNTTTFKPFMTENFYLDDRGIHFIYDPYDIDCYAAGTIDIFVPWQFPVK